MKKSKLDALTNAIERSEINPTLESALSLCRSKSSCFTLMMVDLDHFKSVNDAFGHPRGDQVLVELVRLVKSIIRSHDKIFRYGGDEFLLFLPNSSKMQAVRVAERIQKALKASYLEGTPPLKISVSIGLATFPEEGETAAGLIEVIDRRLYMGKHRGRSNLVVNDDIGSNEDSLQIASPDRMVERENAQEQILAFLQHMSSSLSGVLHIQGEHGSGRTRMLAEFEKLARMQGYTVWQASGSPALQARQGGALSLLLRLNQWNRAWHNPSILHEQIKSWGEENSIRGLMFVLDDIEDIDPVSLEIIYSIIYGGFTFPVGLIYAGLVPQMPPGSGLTVPITMTIPLEPVSELGIQIWLRYCLRWGAPQQFVTWLFEQSGGLPAEIVHHLDWLIEHGFLRAEAHGWSLAKLKDVTVPKTQVSRLERIPSNLAHYLPKFYGREDEIWTLRGQLKKHNLITIIGPDGVGKSRLALQTAAECKSLFPDGVFEIGLHAAISVDEFLFQILRTLSVKIPPSGDPLQGLKEALQDKQILLLLDGFDLQPETSANLLNSIEKLLSYCHGVHFLVTAVKPLGSRQEISFMLQGLEIPQDKAIKDYSYFASIELFLQGTDKQATFIPKEEDWPWILRICRQVEGMPLGIELAAAWVSSYSCEQISTKIERNIGFLSSASEREDTAAANTRSIFAVIDSFWQNFSQVERDTFTALAVIRHSFDQMAARHIAGASPFFLDALTAKKILHMDQPQRYTIHNLLSNYAVLQVSDTSAIEENYTTYYLQLLHRSASQLKNGKTPSSGFDEDLPNFRRAWELAVADQNYMLLLESIDGFFQVLISLGRFVEGIELSELARLSASGSAHAHDPAAQQLIVKTCIKEGELHYHIGSYDPGLAILAYGLECLDGEKEPLQKAAILHLTANLYNAKGQYADALKLLTQSLEIARSLKQAEMIFQLLNRAGVAAYHQKNFEQSKKYFEAALESAYETDNQKNVAVCLNNLGSVAIDLKDYKQARVLLLASLSKCASFSMATLRGSVLESLGTLETHCGNLSEAGSYFVQGLSLLQDMDAVPLMLGFLVNTAVLWQKQGYASKAANLAMFILQFPAAQHDTRQKAAGLLASLPEPTDQEREDVRQPSQLRRVSADVIEFIESSR